MIGLLVDDDALFVRTLQKTLQRRGIEAVTASDVESALSAAHERAFDFALVDLKIGKESGLRLIEPLKAIRAEMRVVMMTGYASVATAVEAIKAGAYDYLLKPVSVDAILRVLTDEQGAPAEDSDAMIPLGRLEWEHIQQALRATDGNISAAARMLGVHRRSLQRKLGKRPAAGASDDD
ncbi:MAG: response regulator transcription factor [Steroidobacteraceae bacterium]